jgi:hypothetical protein
LVPSTCSAVSTLLTMASALVAQEQQEELNSSSLVKLEEEMSGAHVSYTAL